MNIAKIDSTNNNVSIYRRNSVYRIQQLPHKNFTLQEGTNIFNNLDFGFYFIGDYRVETKLSFDLTQYDTFHITDMS